MSRPTRASSAGRAYLDLQNRARREKRGTQELLTMYVVERWLARLARSPYVEDIVLKGGMLLASFGTRRPTVDADALARNMASDVITREALEFLGELFGKGPGARGAVMAGTAEELVGDPVAIAESVALLAQDLLVEVG